MHVFPTTCHKSQAPLGAWTILSPSVCFLSAFAATGEGAKRASGRPPTLKPPPQRCAARCTGCDTSASLHLRRQQAAVDALPRHGRSGHRRPVQANLAQLCAAKFKQPPKPASQQSTLAFCWHRRSKPGIPCHPFHRQAAPGRRAPVRARQQRAQRRPQRVRGRAEQRGRCGRQAGARRGAPRRPRRPPGSSASRFSVRQRAAAAARLRRHAAPRLQLRGQPPGASGDELARKRLGRHGHPALHAVCSAAPCAGRERRSAYLP